MPKKPQPKREFHVGDRIEVVMHNSEIVNAVIKAIVEKTDGLHLQVDLGDDQTGLVSTRQVVNNNG